MDNELIDSTIFDTDEAEKNAIYVYKQLYLLIIAR